MAEQEVEVGNNVKAILSDEALAGGSALNIQSMDPELALKNKFFCSNWGAAKQTLQHLKDLIVGTAWWTGPVRYLVGLIIDRVIKAGDAWVAKHCIAP